MITIFNTYKNTEPLTDAQLSELFRCISIYEDTPHGAWLSEVDYTNYEYLWKKDIEGTHIQAIKPIIGKSIILQTYCNNPLFWVQMMSPVAIHELRHVWQRKEYGFMVYCILAPLGRIPGLSEKAPLERDAFIEQDMAQDIINKEVL